MDIKDTISGFKGVMEGKYDDLPEMAFYMVGFQCCWHSSCLALFRRCCHTCDVTLCLEERRMCVQSQSKTIAFCCRWATSRRCRRRPTRWPATWLRASEVSMAGGTTPAGAMHCVISLLAGARFSSCLEWRLWGSIAITV